MKQSTEVEDHHYYDAALQMYVLAGAGLNVTKVAIVHIDNSYTRRGDLEVQKLFKVVDITANVQEMQPNIASEIADMRAMLSEEMPVIDIGPHCEKPYPCDFKGHCWSHIPEDSVFDLRESAGVNKFELYGKGIVRQADIPLDILNKKQRQQVESTLKQCDSLDKVEVRKFLDSLWYPLCFLDFETVFPAIPLFDGLRPYQQMPFQYSLHIQMSAGAELQQDGFLAQPGVDPREELTSRLLEKIPEGACVIAWNQSFEKGILAEPGGALSRARAAHRAATRSFSRPIVAISRPFRVPLAAKGLPDAQGRSADPCP